MLKLTPKVRKVRSLGFRCSDTTSPECFRVLQSVPKCSRAFKVIQRGNKWPAMHSKDICPGFCKWYLNRDCDSVQSFYPVNCSKWTLGPCCHAKSFVYAYGLWTRAKLGWSCSQQFLPKLLGGSQFSASLPYTYVKTKNIFTTISTQIGPSRTRLWIF